jgi:hypothetical protein
MIKTALKSIGLLWSELGKHSSFSQKLPVSRYNAQFDARSINGLAHCNRKTQVFLHFERLNWSGAKKVKSFF